MGYTIRIGEQEIYWEDGKRKRSVYSADADEPLDFACGEQENCIDLTYKDFGKMVETIGGKFQERMSVGGIWLKDYPGYFKITPFVIRFFEPNACRISGPSAQTVLYRNRRRRTWLLYRFQI